MKHHKLKTWPEFFDAIWKKEKHFDVRPNDRDFQQGDNITFIEYDPISQKETGRQITCYIGFMVYTQGEGKGTTYANHPYSRHLEQFGIKTNIPIAVFELKQLRNWD